MPHEGMPLETRRLLLRKLRQEDLQDFHEMVSSPAVVRYEPYDPMTMAQAAKELDALILSREFTAVLLKESGKVIGNIYLGRRECGALELGFLFNEAYWGQGYAAESCEALIREAFRGGVTRVFAQCDPDNTASWRLLEKLGFSRERHLKRNVYFRTDDKGCPLWKNTYLYAILNQ